jgi:hypothetical protein
MWVTSITYVFSLSRVRSSGPYSARGVAELGLVEDRSCRQACRSIITTHAAVKGYDQSTVVRLGGVVSKDWRRTLGKPLHSRPRVWSIKRRATTFRHQNHSKSLIMYPPLNSRSSSKRYFLRPCKDTAGDGERESSDLRKP